MSANPGAARRELANLGEALTLAERGLPRHSPTDLMAWLLRVLALHPEAMADSMLFHVCDVVSDDVTADADKVALIRMSWAAVVQARFRSVGLAAVEGAGALRARAA